LRRDGVAEMLQRVDDAHSAVLDAVLISWRPMVLA
jgi:hypothetical protein